MLHPFSGILPILRRRGLHVGDTMASTQRILLVTGGGRGIGAATAILAAQQGWAVAVNYAKDAPSAAQVVKQSKTPRAYSTYSLRRYRWTNFCQRS
jgi:hypothetical protein